MADPYDESVAHFLHPFLQKTEGKYFISLSWIRIYGIGLQDLKLWIEISKYASQSDKLSNSIFFKYVRLLKKNNLF